MLYVASSSIITVIVYRVFVARLLQRMRATIISLDLWRLSVRLLVLAQCCMWSSSQQRERSLAVGMMTYTYRLHTCAAHFRWSPHSDLKRWRRTTPGLLPSPAQCFRRFVFGNRVTEKWNNLPQCCINCAALNNFKSHIHQVLEPETKKKVIS